MEGVSLDIPPGEIQHCQNLCQKTHQTELSSNQVSKMLIH